MLSPILYENSEFIAIHKQTGVDVHNSENSVVNIYEEKFGHKFFPVHRLDKETSGCLILAKDSKSARQLAELFQENQIHKVYQAVCKKNPKFNFPIHGLWNQKISNKAEGLKNPQGKAKDRVDAQTEFQTRAQSDHYLLLNLRPLSGRTHQIRKHCALNFCPILGDTRYGNQKANEMAQKLYGFHRMGLHCAGLEFRWKESNIRLEARTPESFLFFNH